MRFVVAISLLINLLIAAGVAVATTSLISPLGLRRRSDLVEKADDCPPW
jgi:hypothetical protein